jgi:hypothetical protein|tara:strand:- start:1602 stop:1781 length:180 start_codon:yes stop_codon:yes gene_type:complete
MDYFINQWASLGDPAKQVIILCGLTMLILFFVLTKLLSEYDKFKYGPDEDDDEEIEVED